MNIEGNYIEFFVPIHASAKATAKKPEDWDKKSSRKKAEYLLNNMEIEGSLCHQCSSEVQTDMEPNLEVAEECLRDEIKYLGI